jgi:hypothetical protein
MYTTSALILALSAFSTALPSLAPKQTTCYTPTTFQVDGFSIFIPATGNPNPESIYFSLGDSATDTGTTCDSTTIPTTSPNNCTNTNFEYLWTGGTGGGILTIGETYTPCSDSYVSLICTLTINIFNAPTANINKGRQLLKYLEISI